MLYIIILLIEYSNCWSKKISVPMGALPERLVKYCSNCLMFSMILMLLCIWVMKFMHVDY